MRDEYDFSKGKRGAIIKPGSKVTKTLIDESGEPLSDSELAIALANSLSGHCAAWLQLKPLLRRMAVHEQALEKIAELNKIGWYVSVDWHANGVIGATAFMGDDNCPVAKEYDFNDGHGYSFITTHYLSEPLPLDKAIEILFEKSKAVKFGEPYPEKKK